MMKLYTNVSYLRNKMQLLFSFVEWRREKKFDPFSHGRLLPREKICFRFSCLLVQVESYYVSRTATRNLIRPKNEKCNIEHVNEYKITKTTLNTASRVLTPKKKQISTKVSFLILIACELNRWIPIVFLCNFFVKGNGKRPFHIGSKIAFYLCAARTYVNTLSKGHQVAYKGFPPI